MAKFYTCHVARFSSHTALMRLPILLVVFSCSLACVPRADGPSDNLPDKVRRIPPPGIKIPDSDRAELVAGAAELGKELQSLREALKSKPALLALVPDVEIYHKAVDWALRFDELYKSNEVQVARALLQQGRERAGALRDGKPGWTTATGLVVRGYVSKIDGSVQPYG